MNKERAIQMRIGVTGAMLILAMGASTVTAQVTQNSTTWENTYEADQTPVAAGWTNLWGFDGVASVVPDPCDPCNNYIHVECDDWYQGFEDQPDPCYFDPNTNGGISLEWRMNVTNGTFIMHIWPGDGLLRRWLTVYVYPDVLRIRSNDSASAELSAFFDDPNDPNNDGWHIYRVTCDDVDWNVYRYRYQGPDEPVYSGWLTTPVESSAAEVTALRLYGETDTTVFDLDYFRWTDHGALLPGPPTECGAPGSELVQTDINDDCYVNTEDLTLFADEWLKCNNPEDPNCDPPVIQ